MATSERRITIRGHKPRRLPRSFKRVDIDLSEIANVTVVVRSKGSNAEWSKLLAESISGLPKDREYLTRAELGKAWGASPAELEEVSAFGRAHGLKTVSSDSWRRCVVVSGTLAQLQKAFGVTFFGVEHPFGVFRSHRGSPQVTASVYPIVEAVLGLDNIPSAEPELARRGPASPTELNLRELRKVYGFPPRYQGKGQCVAVIELGGGIRKTDYTNYFKRIGVSPPALRVRTISGATNQPATPAAMRPLAELALHGPFWPPPNQPVPTRVVSDQTTIWTWETAMDLEIVGTLAPEATLLLLIGTDDDQGQYHAVTSALADARNAPSVISCSWSATEAGTTPVLMPVLDRWFQAAAILGVTVCYSSGDRGDGTSIYPPAPKLTFVANFPGTSPYVLACGGTTLDVTAGTETAWNQTIGDGLPMQGGGGFSEVFPRPSWQISAGIDAADWIPAGATSGTGRGIPDVCAKANLDPAFCVLASGTEIPAGGTSAAAPLWAALIAVFNQALGCPVGLINPLLYEGGLRKALRDITKGNIGHLRARKGWDPASGWGSPHGEAMLKVLRGRG